MKIINQGTQIYFDIKGKHKRDVFVEYPLAVQKGMNMQSMSGNRPDRMGGAGGRSGGGGGRSGGGMSGPGGNRTGGGISQGGMPSPINIWFLVDLHRE